MRKFLSSVSERIVGHLPNWCNTENENKIQAQNGGQADSKELRDGNWVSEVVEEILEGTEESGSLVSY